MSRRDIMNILPSTIRSLDPKPFPDTLDGDLPSLTIVTPVLDRVGHIARAIESVSAQGYERSEHIVVDGGSVDGTEDVIRRYGHVKLIAGRDANAHEAINKGLATARGEIVGFLNSDDTYAPGALLEVGRYFRDNHEAMVVFGRAFIEEEALSGERRVVEEIVHLTDPELLWSELLYGAPAFNSWFFRRSVFENFGNLDAGIEISADRDFLTRLAIAGIWPDSLLGPCYSYLRHAESATFEPAVELVLAQLHEHIAMAERLVVGPMDHVQRSRIANWCAFERYQLLIRLWRHRGLARAVGGLLHVLVAEPAWPIRLWRALAARERYRRALKC
jgi:glycosyltransferase involved in cell wall biosynthesis